MERGNKQEATECTEYKPDRKSTQDCKCCSGPGFTYRSMSGQQEARWVPAVYMCVQVHFL